MPLIGRGRTRRRLEGTTEARNTTPIAALNLRDDGNLSSENSTQQPDDVPSIEPYSPPDVDSPGNTNGPPTRKHGRGPAKSTEFEKLRKHGKITLKINDGETSPCCENYVVFTTRVTWILKHHGDLSHPSWHDVPENEQQELISRVRADFILDWTKKNHCDTVMKALRKRFNHIRYDLHKRYKQYGTNEEALANGPHLVSPENWVKLCSRWSSEGFKMISERNKCNREKQQTNHTTGRTSFVRLLEMRSENDGDNLVDFFKEVRWSKKKGTFVTPMMEEMHNKMAVKMSELEPEKRTKEAAAEVFREVLGHRSGYARGLSEMVIPESSRQRTNERVAELSATAARHEKDAEYYKRQLDELRGNVEVILERQQEYDKFMNTYMSERQNQGESHRET